MVTKTAEVDLLDVGAHFLHDLLEARGAVGGLGGVHLVVGHDQLLHAQGEGQQPVLEGLPLLGDARLKLAQQPATMNTVQSACSTQTPRGQGVS